MRVKDREEEALAERGSGDIWVVWQFQFSVDLTTKGENR
jgi:hypothetical protein